MIADDPQSFARAVHDLNTRPELWTRLSRNGLDFIQRHFTPKAVGKVLNRIIFEEKSPGTGVGNEGS